MAHNSRSRKSGKLSSEESDDDRADPTFQTPGEIGKQQRLEKKDLARRIKERSRDEVVVEDLKPNFLAQSLTFDKAMKLHECDLIQAIVNQQFKINNIDEFLQVWNALPVKNRDFGKTKLSVWPHLFVSGTGNHDSKGNTLRGRLVTNQPWPLQLSKHLILEHRGEMNLEEFKNILVLSNNKSERNGEELLEAFKNRTFKYRSVRGRFDEPNSKRQQKRQKSDEIGASSVFRKGQLDATEGSQDQGAADGDSLFGLGDGLDNSGDGHVPVPKSSLATPYPSFSVENGTVVRKKGFTLIGNDDLKDRLNQKYGSTVPNLFYIHTTTFDVCYNLSISDDNDKWVMMNVNCMLEIIAPLCKKGMKFERFRDKVSDPFALAQSILEDQSLIQEFNAWFTNGKEGLIIQDNDQSDDLSHCWGLTSPSTMFNDDSVCGALGSSAGTGKPDDFHEKRDSEFGECATGNSGSSRLRPSEQAAALPRSSVKAAAKVMGASNINETGEESDQSNDADLRPPDSSDVGKGPGDDSRPPYSADAAPKPSEVSAGADLMPSGSFGSRPSTSSPGMSTTGHSEVSDPKHSVAGAVHNDSESSDVQQSMMDLFEDFQAKITRKLEANCRRSMEKRESELTEKQRQADEREAKLSSKEAEVNAKEAALKEIEARVKADEVRVKALDESVNAKEAALKERDTQVKTKEASVDERESRLGRSEAELNAKDSALKEREAQIALDQASLATERAKIAQREKNLVSDGTVQDASARLLQLTAMGESNDVCDRESTVLITFAKALGLSIEDMKRQLSELSVSKEKLEGEHGKCAENLQKLKSEVEKLTQSENEIKVRVAAGEEKIRDIDQRYNARVAEIAAANDAFRAREEAIRLAEEQNEAKKQENRLVGERLEKALRATESEKDQCKTFFDKYKKKEGDLPKRESELERRVNQVSQREMSCNQREATCGEREHLLGLRENRCVERENLVDQRESHFNATLLGSRTGGFESVFGQNYDGELTLGSGHGSIITNSMKAVVKSAGAAAGGAVPPDSHPGK